MGRSRKCNWKRKQLRRDKKIKGKEEFGSFLSKGRGSDYVVFLGHDGFNEMKAAFKKVFENSDVELIRSSPNHLKTFLCSDGRYVDSDFGVIDKEELRKIFDAAAPTVVSSYKGVIGVPVIFGTGGGFGASDCTDSILKNKGAEYFKKWCTIPYEEESGPFPNSVNEENK